MCRAPFVIRAGVWATFIHTGIGRYPLTDAVGTYRTEQAAEQAADTEQGRAVGLVVRFVGEV